MAGSLPAATERRRSGIARALGRAGGLAMMAVFGVGLITSVTLVALGALIVYGFGLTAAGIGVAIAGLAVGVVYAVAQGALG